MNIKTLLITSLFASSVALRAAQDAPTTSATTAAKESKPEAVVYSVDPAHVVRKADLGVYGHFLEHIFNSIHGGLWGDMILNPSLEQNGPLWILKNGTVTVENGATEKKLCFGDVAWGDYDLSLEARREEKWDGAMMVMFRVSENDGRAPFPEISSYRVILGAEDNKVHRIEKNGRLLAKLTTPGSIESGKWHRVRISCRGPKFIVWLDDAKIFEFEDPDKPLLTGRIGVDAFRTLPSFRNIKVTSADGKVLWDRLPTEEEIIAAPAYWKQSIGKLGSITNEKKEAFNDVSSLVLRGSDTGEERGLSQGPKNLVKGEKYQGSLWLRSPDGGTAIVRFRDSDGKVLCEQAFENIPAEWTKREITLTAPSDATDAVFEVAAKGKDSVSLDMINLFPQSALDTGGFRPDLLKAIKDLKPASIRYPGGSFIAHYNWKDTIGPREKRRYYPHEIWDDRESNQFGTDEFIQLCRLTGAEPVIPVPIGRNDDQSVQEAVDWLEYCNGAPDTKWGKVRADNGHPEPYNVKIWEIGNEEWGRGAAKYAEAVNKFSKAMKAKDPTIKIAACGAYGYDNGPSLCDGWNKALIDASAKEMDLLSIHYYNGIGAPPMDQAKDPVNYEAYIRDGIGPIIRNSANPNIKVYCSEWGQMNIDWRSGLYTAGLLNGFERLGSDLMTMSCPAVWLQAVQSRTKPAPRWASSSILFDHRSWCGVPVYVVQKLWREHFGPKVVQLDGPATPLNAIASTSEDGRTLYFKAVNTTDQERQVELKINNSFKVTSTALEVIAPGDLMAMNTLDKPDRIAATNAPVTTDGQTLRFTLPAQSAAALQVK